jgi:amino acid transporter
MSVWTLGGFEAAANVAEETHFPEKRIPMAILMAEVAAVFLGLAVLIGFTLAVPSVEVASNHATPLLYIIGSYFPNWVVDIALLLVSIAIFACVLANLTTITRLIWAMARDGKVPASKWLSRVSEHKVPVNAIWVVVPITAIFTFWAQVEVVIIAICTLAMYVTYGLVVGAALWGKKAEQNPVPGEPAPKRVSRGLCIAALTWIIAIIGLLLFMTAITMSRRSLITTLISVVLTGVVVLLIVWIRGKNAATPDLRPAEEESHE